LTDIKQVNQPMQDDKTSEHEGEQLKSPRLKLVYLK